MLDENEAEKPEKGPSQQASTILIATAEAVAAIELEEEKELEVKKRKSRRAPKLIMNLHYTQYPEVKIIARKLGFKVRNDDLNLLVLSGSDATPGPI
jgi:hypothetical protein